MDTTYETRGYLIGNYRLFHLTNREQSVVDWHYHTFHKIIFLLGGQVDYDVEGQTYHLQAGDALLVGCGDVHRPSFLGATEYDRLILYISPEFLAQNSPEDRDLSQCFALSRQRFSFAIQGEDALLQLVKQLEIQMETPGFAKDFLCENLFFQVMVLLNRQVLGATPSLENQGDAKIRQVLQFIHNHLTEPLSLEEIASQCFISKYHMMRRFKEETGYSIHNYRSNKRLFLARELLKKGNSAAQACYGCGFQDYSTFARAYKKQFGHSPKS